MRLKPIVLSMLIAGFMSACTKEEQPQPHASNQAESLTTSELDWNTPQQGAFEM